MGERTKTNSNAAVALTLGILAIMIPGIGLVLGLVGIFISRKALREMEKTKEDGKGFATAGMVCSIVGVIVQLSGIFLIAILSFFTIG